MGKFYAVRNGRKTGIFETWDECSESVKGYSGAVFKSFTNYEDACKFVDKQPESPVQQITLSEKSKPYAFVDGSFNKKTNVYGFGGILFDGTDYHIIKGFGYDPDMCEMRNVSGEILGTMEAVKLAEYLEIKELDIYYDYEGICAWATSTWSARKDGTKKYAQFMKDHLNSIHVNFKKVTAHTGVTGNEYADVLAKTAVGIDLTRIQKNLLADALKLCKCALEEV